jgi:hypothetical protein
MLEDIMVPAVPNNPTLALQPGNIDGAVPDFTSVNPGYACSVASRAHDFFSTGTGTPAIFTLKEPRLVRVQK